MTDKFDPKIYLGRRSITLKTQMQGIRKVWDWNDKKLCYEFREHGLKYRSFIKVNGVQREKFFESLAEAKAFRSNPDKISAYSSQITLFSEVVEKFFENKKAYVSRSTLETYKIRTKHFNFLSSYKIKEISSFVIDTWLVNVKSKEYLELQHDTRISFKKELILLKQIFVFYQEYFDESLNIPVTKRHMRDAVVSQEKFRISKARNKTRYMTKEEMELFLDNLARKAISSESHLHYYALAFFQLHTGSRIGEASAVRVKDFNFSLNPVRVNISRTVQWKRGKDSAETYIQDSTKTGEVRNVYVSEPLKNIVLNLVEKYGLKPEDLVFSSSKVKPLSYRSIQYQFNKAFEELGLNFRSTHIHRHSFSTEFLRLTRDQHALSKILGHSSLKQTEHYSKITDSMAENGYMEYSKSLEERPENLLVFKREAV
jgi:integrase